MTRIVLLTPSKHVVIRAAISGWGPAIIYGNCLQVLEINNVTTYQFIEAGISFVPITGKTERLGYWQVISMNITDFPSQ